MKYFKKFKEKSDRIKSNLSLPNISLISSFKIKKVIFNPKPNGEDYFYIDGDTLIFYKYSQVSIETLDLERGEILDNNDILLL